MRKLLLPLLLVVGCTDNKGDGFTYVAGFDPPPVADGFTRYVTAPIEDVQPGADDNYCQWVADPSDVDRQVVDFQKYQSAAGHHLVLYATSKIEPIGTTEICSVQDMLSVNFLGGGEGSVTSAIQLPGGYAFDLPANMALMVNDHYLNATDETLTVQSVADVKFGDPNDLQKPVGFVAVDYEQFDVPANSSATSDAYCTATTTLSFFMWGNHMHQYGASETSEIIHPDKTTTMLESSPQWSPELMYNTPWITWDVTAPYVVNPGDVFHLTCSWNNTTSNDVMFPTEMCVGTGFVLEAMPQSVCEAGPPGT